MTTPKELRRGDPGWPAGVIEPNMLYVIGDTSLLRGELVGFLCSRQCPGRAIRAAFDAIVTLRSAGLGVVGGFHSPIEQECLSLLARRDVPIVHCLARSLERLRLSPDRRDAVGRGVYAVVSCFGSGAPRTTAKTSEKRNALVSMLCGRLVVPHASPAGSIERLCLDRLARGGRVIVLDSGCTRLLGAGAEFVDADKAFAQGLA